MSSKTDSGPGYRRGLRRGAHARHLRPRLRRRSRRACRRARRPRRRATARKRGIGSTRCQARRCASGSVPPAEKAEWRSQRTVLHSTNVGPAARPRALDARGRPPRAPRATSLPSTIVGRHAEAAGTVGDVRRRLALRRRHRDRDAVVLADEDERHLPQHRHVQRLEELALARGAVAEEARARPGRVPRNWQESATPPAIGMWPATMAFVETSPTRGLGEVHRPALALADTGRARPSARP